MAMVTRFCIQDEIGRFLNREGLFSYDDADAVEFRWEDDAIEELAAHPGCTVESYSRVADHPDFHIETVTTERAAA